MVSNTKNKKGLTEKQQAFYNAYTDVDNLKTFGDAGASKTAAGYSPYTSSLEVLNAMPNEILDAINTYILGESMKSAKSIVDVRNDPSQLGAANKLKAADSILDRGGIVKKSQVEVVQENPSGIFFLPAKEPNSRDESDSSNPSS